MFSIYSNCGAVAIHHATSRMPTSVNYLYLYIYIYSFCLKFCLFFAYLFPFSFLIDFFVSQDSAVVMLYVISSFVLFMLVLLVAFRRLYCSNNNNLLSWLTCDVFNGGSRTGSGRSNGGVKAITAAGEGEKSGGNRVLVVDQRRRALNKFNIKK